MIFNSDYVGINISKTDCKSAFEVFVQGGMLESIANGGSFLEGFEDGALSGAISGENIISTYDHPYYVKDKGFVSAGALWIGAELIDKDGNVVLD